MSVFYKFQDLQQSIDNGGIAARVTEMLNEALQAFAGRGRPQLFKCDGEDDNVVEVPRWICVSQCFLMLLNKFKFGDAYKDSFLIRSLKESSSAISGKPWKKLTCWPAGDGERGGSLAPGTGRDLTRRGMAVEGALSWLWLGAKDYTSHSVYREANIRDTC